MFWSKLFSKFSVTSPTWQLILLPFRRFTYDTAHSPTLPLLYLRQAHSPTNSYFTYVTVNSPTLLSLLLRHRILTYVTWRASHAVLSWLIFNIRHMFWSNLLSNLSDILLRHNSFSKHYVALPTSQLILQPFRCSTYVTVHSSTLLSLLLRHRIFTYFTWRDAHAGLSYLIFNIRLTFWSNLFSFLSDISPTLPLIL